MMVPAATSISIDSPRALADLRRSLSLFHPTRPGTRIVIDEAALGSEAKRAERRVNVLYARCGCATGQLAVLGTIVWLAARHFGGLPFDRRFALVATGAVLVAAIAGKLVGIFWSRALLVALLGRLERRASHTKPA